MITPPRTHFFFFFLQKKHCAQLMPTMCKGRQLPGETVAKRSSCLTEARCRNLYWMRVNQLTSQSLVGRGCADFSTRMVIFSPKVWQRFFGEGGLYLVRNMRAGSMLTEAMRPTWRISLAIIRSFSKFTRPSTLESFPERRRRRREWISITHTLCSWQNS